MAIKKLVILLIIIISFNQKITSQNTASKSVSTFKLRSPQLDTLKQIWLYLPKNYKTSKKRYPVVYMLDAQNLFDNESAYASEWNIDEFLDQLQEKQAIVVGIEHGNEKRFEELSPYKNEKYGGGNADAFLDFIVNTVKPHIDSSYRTKKKAKHTSIVGASLGGLFSFYATIKQPKVFRNAGVFSPSFWFNPEIYKLTEDSKICKKSKFYFVTGGDEPNEMLDGQKQMIDLFNKKGIKKKQYQNIIAENYGHNEKLWRTYFPIAYMWVFNFGDMQ